MTDKSIKRRMKELELEEKENEVEKSKIDLRLRRLDEVRYGHQHGLLADANKGVFRLEEAVYSEALNLATSMNRFSEANPKKPLELHIFSPGGSILHGIALYDTLRTLSARGHQVTTVVRGYCGSMASILFLAGDRRLIGAESLMHQHEPSSVAYGKLSEMQDANAFVTTLYEKMTRIYVERTNVTRTVFRKKTVGKEWWIEAPEALSLGMATELG